MWNSLPEHGDMFNRITELDIADGGKREYKFNLKCKNHIKLSGGGAFKK